MLDVRGTGERRWTGQRFNGPYGTLAIDNMPTLLNRMCQVGRVEYRA